VDESPPIHSQISSLQDLGISLLFFGRIQGRLPEFQSGPNQIASCDKEAIGKERDKKIREFGFAAEFRKPNIVFSASLLGLLVSFLLLDYGIRMWEIGRRGEAWIFGAVLMIEGSLLIIILQIGH
jgi:hypothetical protein